MRTLKPPAPDFRSLAGRGALLLVLSAGVCRAQNIVDIGIPPGGPDSLMTGLSNDGTAASATCNCSPQRALRWTAAGGLVVLPTGAGASSASAFSISGDGLREGGSIFVTAISGRIPTYWVGTAGPLTFSMPAGWTQGVINASNDNGTLHAGALTNSLGGPTVACRLSTVGAHVTFAVPGFGSTAANTCSGDGQYLAGTATTPGVRSFWWHNGTLVLMPLAPGAVEMRALGIQHDGTTVVGGALLPANVHKAFKWTAADGPALLDTVDPALETQAVKVSTDGSVVLGNSVYTIATGGALIWIDGQPGIYLRDYLEALGVNTTGWRLDGVSGISLDGRTLAGTGQHNGQTRGYVIQNLPSVCVPVILAQPQPLAAVGGADAVFSVAAGPSTVAYTWFHDLAALVDGPTGTGSTVSGAAAALLTISNVSSADAGAYWCVVSNACGSVSSDQAALSVTPGCGTITETVQCGATCNGVGQECGMLFELTRDTCGDFRVEYTTAPSHCSNVGMKFFVDGVLVVQTPPVGPGVSMGEIDLGPLPPGPHTLGMEGVGEEGGCNTGYLEAWSGTMHITYCVSQPEFNIQPQDASACASGSVAYTVAVGGGGPSTLTWQVSDPALPGEWRDMVDGDTPAASGRIAFTASGAGTSLLSLSFGPGFSDDWAGDAAQVRCIAVNTCGGAISDAAALSFCYANCDCSAVPPVLTANDFQCFLNLFASGSEGANCDRSNVPPVLTANDFQCFLNRYVAGCP